MPQPGGRLVRPRQLAGARQDRLQGRASSRVGCTPGERREPRARVGRGGGRQDSDEGDQHQGGGRQDLAGGQQPVPVHPKEHPLPGCRPLPSCDAVVTDRASSSRLQGSGGGRRSTRPAEGYAGRVRRRVEDLHGFDTRTALQFVVTRVAEAYRNGYDEIEFTHGAAAVRERPATGRGQIKWALRDLLESGRLDEWSRPGDCWPREASMVVALKRNPRPRTEFWSPAPRLGRPR
jgi:hypothetical protein